MKVTPRYSLRKRESLSLQGFVFSLPLPGKDCRVLIMRGLGTTVYHRSPTDLPHAPGIRKWYFVSSVRKKKKKKEGVERRGCQKGRGEYWLRLESRYIVFMVNGK
ncbi:hypothetical protein CEXT_784131 [Caerostris extrusa]|uniref:Uncharacterized protein n=1 Tax=Caerostris extrusa TaxID=172846 RepID=A0AAV4TAQ5_CAEEX|nr:hypothetical protein CEXT_784131 [Caerostris extrusa]